VDKSKECLLIFAKNSQIGKVKTRLAVSVGDRRALEVYRQLLRLTKQATDPLDVSRQVWYSDHITDNDLWPAEGYAKHQQEGRDLGQRMKAAFGQAFSRGFKKVVIIGSDCPDITTSLLRQAFERLETHEAVIGPAADGGYYLLGMSQFFPELFELKEWSTASVYARTAEQLRNKEISYALLPKLYEIDTEGYLKESSLML